jgi:hypothetical protein
LAVFTDKDLEGLIQEVLEAALRRGVELGK